MLKSLIISILGISGFISCGEGESDKLPKGSHKVYVDCYGTKTVIQTELAGEIEVKSEVVKKIISPNNSNIPNFDFWETKGSKSQVVYSTGDKVYTVYIIPDN